MKRLYIVTGADGHLGSTILRLLKKEDGVVHALILPDKKGTESHVKYFKGDVRDKESLRCLFQEEGEYETILFHTAGIVDITGRLTESMEEVNIEGTRNVVELCREYQVKRLVYVSSVHAIQERKGILSEVSKFSPDRVVGGYAKTKASATRLVLEAVQQGLDAVIVHPSGILGPGDKGSNHLVQMVWDFVDGKLPACIKGGYDFVDVRDVAKGCVLAGQKGKKGECYILSGGYYEISQIFRMAKGSRKKGRIPVLPLWMAYAGVPVLGLISRMRGERPLFTTYSLYTLRSNGRFSCEKAKRELGYSSRPMENTLADMMREHALKKL